MDLGDLRSFPNGEKIFVDSNILTYHFLNHLVYGRKCKEFIGRIEKGDIEGFISPIIVSEALFNFIKAYIVKNYGIRSNEVISFLKARFEVLYDIETDKASELFGIFDIISISELEVKRCYKFINNYALLTNDAFHLATMKKRGLTNIATNDRDFERIEWLSVWKP